MKLFIQYLFFSNKSILKKNALVFCIFILNIGENCAQKISLDKLVKFDNIAYLEYDRIRQSLFKHEQYRNHIKWWYKTSKNDSGIISVSKFILKIDTLKTYLYRNGILTVFANDSEQQYSEIIDSVEVCKKYHPYFSLPHLSFGSIYRTYLDSNNTNLSYTKIENHIRFQINGNFSDKNVDTSFYKEIIINADIVDSCIKFSGIKILTNKNDSAVTKLYYTKCPLKISNNFIDSIIENSFIKYKNYSELKPTNKATNREKTSKINLKDTLNLINNSKLPIKDSTVKLILYDFWYISCIPCINSIPFINQL